MQEVLKEEPKIIETDIDAKDGQQKCPKCGATDISLNVNEGTLRCNFCRYEFKSEKVQGLETDLTKLEGEIMASGAQDIVEGAEDIVTLKCTSCGAEVVIDTSEVTYARCHWCRNTLTINQQVPNGAIPDVVLPFKLKKEEARNFIEGFVNKRKFFAHPTFKAEFTTENIMGVYFPYMVVDANSHAYFNGEAEIETKRYTIDDKTYYDADVYNVEREFDLTIEGLTVESSEDKLNKKAKDKTTNIINSIMPFDVENSVKWNSNYLKGYSSEKRDTNIDELRPLVDVQVKDIARFAANKSMPQYDRGARWYNQQVDVKGKQWKSAYLPVWLYSYQQVKDNGEKLLHYVAVNARTKETMGSVPIHTSKLLAVSAIIELISIVTGSTIAYAGDFEDGPVGLGILLCLSGFAFFAMMKAKYRNKAARHYHETETKTSMFNLRKIDQFREKRKKLRNSQIEGANNKTVNGASSEGIKGTGLEKFANDIMDDMNNWK